LAAHSHWPCAAEQIQNGGNYPRKEIAAGAQTGGRYGLNLLEPRLMDSYPTVIIPFDDRVIFIGLLDCAEFSCVFSEVPQTLDAISGIDFLVGSRRRHERGLLSPV